MPMTAQQVAASKAFTTPQWYYSIELAPGVTTKGLRFKNVALTRELLRRTAVERRRCLDIGIMEGLVATLLERRGAASVVGYDRVERPSKLDLVRAALDSKYELVAGMKLAELPQALQQRQHAPFDVVVFSGVLYHMFDPLSGLATVRGLVRDGGILIVETATVMNAEMAAYFNAKGRFASGTNYWDVSAGMLEYMLRMLRLRPLDAVCFRERSVAGSELTVGRGAVACRAVERFLPEADDQWMLNPQLALDFNEFVDWKRTASTAPAVAYDAERPGLVRRSAELGIDLAASLAATAEFKVSDAQIALPLGAKF
jgi:2-polyprenyl-3-methyl-5-hydroxy-6-metoxy-1,4-benzoquinol methylase